MKNLMLKAFVFSLLFLVYISAFSQSITTTLPKKINPKELYLFYLHGKIIEDQGAKAVHQEYGKYEYQNILTTLKNAGFNVISEARPINTDVDAYSSKVIMQIDSLLKSGVPPENITVIGASKGAGIAVLISSKLKNERINFVFMGICGADLDYSSEEFQVCGKILSIYEKSDPWAYSCQKMITPGRPCISKSKEVELSLGVGHGFLYKPYKEWVSPAAEWAKENKSKVGKK